MGVNECEDNGLRRTDSCYAKEGVHKRMQGVIWEEQEKDGSWLVLFPRYGEKADIADLCIE